MAGIGRRLLVSGVVCAALSLNVFAQQPAPDNSGSNRRDQKESKPTADQQHNSKGDLNITRKIRRSIVDDKSLSTYAHNVKVITQDGRVTLKGPVRNEAERRTVQQKAAEVVGDANVTNDLSVTPN